MKFFIRHYSEYKKLLNKASDKIDPVDFPIFCMTLGYLFNQIEEFQLLYTTLETALEMVANDRFPETEYFQWLIFLNENPRRFGECIQFIQNINNDESIDVIDQIETLFSSEIYLKRPLKAQNRYNSVDTVVMDHADRLNMLDDEQEKVQNKVYEHFDGQKREKSSFLNNDDNQAIKKMQEDEDFARKLQQQQEQYAKDYKSKMKQEETLCEICYVDLYEGNPCFLDKCGHGFHQECLAESFKANIITNSFPLKCPDAECSKECLESDIKIILSEDFYKKYQDHTLKAYAEQNGESVSWCPTPSCGYMFFFEKGDQPRFQCIQCKKEYCLNCRCDWHKDMTCAEYKISNTMSEEDKKFLDFAKGHKFKQCPKCKFWVEKTEGCDHMRCKCKFEFCYKCGGVYMKCDCMAKARQEHQRRLAARRAAQEESKRRKAQKAKEKAAEKLKEKLEKAAQKAAQKNQKPDNRRGRSKRGKD